MPVSPSCERHARRSLRTLKIPGPPFVTRRPNGRWHAKKGVQFSSVQDGIYALGKAHMRSTLSLSEVSPALSLKQFSEARLRSIRHCVCIECRITYTLLCRSLSGNITLVDFVWLCSPGKSCRRWIRTSVFPRWITTWKGNKIPYTESLQLFFFLSSIF